MPTADDVRFATRFGYGDRSTRQQIRGQGHLEAHLAAAAPTPGYRLAAQQACGDGAGRGGGHDPARHAGVVAAYGRDLALLLQFKFSVGRMLVRVTCSGGLRALEHGVVLESSAVGLLYGA